MISQFRALFLVIGPKLRLGLVVALGFVIRPALVLADPLVGTLPGTFNVDNKGAANYTIPLAIPPGRGGLQPTLALAYNSQSSNGPIGIGWSVQTGFPQAITRGRSILARDGVVRGVNFDSNDKFYLDGKRLIVVSGNYGEPGSTYRTEVDSFQEIAAAGSVGIETFTATDKTGVKYVFGKVPGEDDGFQKGGGEAGGLAYAYALKRVEDAVGNYLVFAYNDRGDGEYVLGQIDYTGQGTTITPQASVEFSYSTSADAPVSFIAGRHFKQSARLDHITTKINVAASPQIAARYDLAYDFTSAVKRSRLTSVTPFLADTVSPYALQAAPAHVLNWSVGPEDFSAPGAFYTPTNSDYRNTKLSLTGDFNGDGRGDVLFYSGNAVVADGGVMVCYRDESGSWQQQTHSLGTLPSGMRLITTGDFNGDGRTDLVFMMPGKGSVGGGWYVSFSTGTGFTGLVILTLNYSPSGNLTSNKCNMLSAVVVDLDGNGVDELMFQVEQTQIVYNFSWLFDTGETSSMFGLPPRASNTSFIRPDGPLHLIRPQVSDGVVTFTESVLSALPFSSAYQYSPMALSRIDLDGDGRSDLLASAVTVDVSASTYGTMYWHTESLRNNGGDSFALGETVVDHDGFIGAGEIPLGHMKLTGDVTGDGLDDVVYFRLGSFLEEYNGWFVAVSKGDGTFDHESFSGVSLEESVGGTPTATYNQRGGIVDIGHEGDEEVTYFVSNMNGFEIAGVILLDYNGDGRKDFVWHSPSGGWRCFLAEDTGFDVSTAIPVIGSATDSTDYYVDSRYSGAVDSDFAFELATFDADGAGRESLVLFEREAFGGTGWNVKAISLLRNMTQYPYSLVKFTDGLGAKNEIVYAPISLDSVYTSGVDVSYPIRESRKQVVVSDVWRDTGAAAQSHFSYQYSGNRVDLSGRGGLGFHSFVTLDHQTNLFKYQFLTQSFPMTGLTARDETYRYLGSGKFRAISSHDNTVVFDEVVKSSSDAMPWGTVFPYISKAVEYRWENSDTEHFTLTDGGPSSRPEGIFPLGKPSGEHIKITAESWFDGETATHTTLPADFNPSDTTGGGANAVTGVLAYSTIQGLGLPRKIYYGNLTRLKTDFGDSFTETVTTTYHAPSGALTGLVNTVNTTVTAPSPYSSEAAPEKSYTYWWNGGTPTPLVASETVNATDNELDLTTTYTRDSRGRITNTQVSGYNSPGHARHVGDYSVTSATAFNDTFDLPTTTKNAAPYLHATTAVYHSLLGLPTSVTDVNGVQVTTDYDALGRVTKTKNVSTGIETTTEYAWTSPGASDWKKTQTVSGPGGLTLDSVYAVRMSTTVQPAVTAYHDRLGRVIRTVKAGFGAQTATTDTAYNILGQVVAVSNPYAASPVNWTTHAYDPLGRVVTTTAPNTTTTTNTYQGRFTTVTVDAGNLGDVDPGAQSTTTLVDAKGRTVKVWNADNVPTISGGTSATEASIEFKLDGFGRMRGTKLKDQTAEITASYDALGRQTSLSDPDKGNWTYLNNALGQVVGQSDGRGTVTVSKFDRLGRPLTRVTTEPGAGAPVENAAWYYYDAAAEADWNLVGVGAKGWIGAVQRAVHSVANTPGYPDPGSTKYFYYDTKGRPEIVLSNIDDKWFYTQTTYDSTNRVDTVRHYWRPSPHESPNNYPGLWDDFGYTYSYDTKSYVLTVKDTLNRTWWAAHATTGYDYLDRPVLVQKGAAHWTQRTYRASDGVLASITTGPTAGATTIQNQAFAFDGLGNLRSRSGQGGTETFNYDILNRVTTSKQGAISYYDNGNIKTKLGVGGETTTNYAYGSTRPHAVTAAFGYAMAYDGNGNLATRTGNGETWSLAWTGFDKPRWMAKTEGSVTQGSEFLYDANRSRVLHLEFDALNGSAVPSHYTRKKVYAAGAALEVDYTNTAAAGVPAAWKQNKIRLYIPAPDGIAGAVELPPADVGGLTRDLVYHHDHLGSIESITSFGNAIASTYATDSGDKDGLFSEDAWGARRDPLDWLGAPATTDDGGPDSLSPRGFTGHEMLDGLDLVHMNGRIYDPLLGRFLSADLLVQAPGNLQSFNRYSYVMNNPLTMTDPSGFVGAVMTLDKNGKVHSVPLGPPASREATARLAGVADVLVADTAGAATFVVGYIGSGTNIDTASFGAREVSGMIKEGITSLTGIPQSDPDRRIAQGVTELATIAYAGVKTLTSVGSQSARSSATAADDAVNQGAKQIDSAPPPKVETTAPAAGSGDTISAAPATDAANPRNLVSRQGPSEMNNNQVKRLTNDMKANGFDPNKPIEVAQVDGKNIIINGHHRTEAAKRAGIDEVPIKKVEVSVDQAEKLAREAAEAAEERLRRQRDR